VEIIKADRLTLERSILMNTLSSDKNAIGLLVFILRRIINRLVLHNLVKYSLKSSDGAQDEGCDFIVDDSYILLS